MATAVVAKREAMNVVTAMTVRVECNKRTRVRNDDVATLDFFSHAFLQIIPNTTINSLIYNH